MGYNDASFEMGKSTSGYNIMCQGATISWGSTKQASTSLSSCKAEIYANRVPQTHSQYEVSGTYRTQTLGSWIQSSRPRRAREIELGSRCMPTLLTLLHKKRSSTRLPSSIGVRRVTELHDM